MTRRPNTRGRRCLSTPNDQSGSSQMNLPSAQVGSNHSASITNTGSSSQEGVQTNPTSPNEVHANAQDGPQVAASSSTQRKPKNASWNVNVIGMSLFLYNFSFLLILYFHCNLIFGHMSC